MTNRRRIFGLGGALGLLIGLYACNAPYIPLPPPASPEFAAVTVPDGMGGSKTVWQASGSPLGASANAKVFVFNATVETGVIAKALPDGSYVAAPIDGQLGDRVEIFYETPKGEVSPTICRALAVGLATEPCP